MCKATIGYGDIVARSNEERLVNVAVMAIGVSFFGYVIGTISSLVTNLDVAAALYDERMTVVKEYIISRQIPKHMNKKIRDHFEYYFQNRSVFKERKILKRLPAALRNEMIHHAYAKLVSSIKYFTQCHESLISDIVMIMHPCSVLKNEYVYVQHEIAAHVFFLVKGKVHLSRTLPNAKGDVQLGTHTVGEHFGEVCACRFDPLEPICCVVKLVLRVFGKTDGSVRPRAWERRAHVLCGREIVLRTHVPVARGDLKAQYVFACCSRLCSAGRGVTGLVYRATSVQVKVGRKCSSIFAIQHERTPNDCGAERVRRRRSMPTCFRCSETTKWPPRWSSRRCW